MQSLSTSTLSQLIMPKASLLDAITIHSPHGFNIKNLVEWPHDVTLFESPEK